MAHDFRMILARVELPLTPDEEIQASSEATHDQD